MVEKGDDSLLFPEEFHETLFFVIVISFMRMGQVVERLNK